MTGYATLIAAWFLLVWIFFRFVIRRQCIEFVLQPQAKSEATFQSDSGRETSQNAPRARGFESAYWVSHVVLEFCVQHLLVHGHINAQGDVTAELRRYLEHILLQKVPRLSHFNIHSLCLGRSLPVAAVRIPTGSKHLRCSNAWRTDTPHKKEREGSPQKVHAAAFGETGVPLPVPFVQNALLEFDDTEFAIHSSGQLYVGHNLMLPFEVRITHLKCSAELALELRTDPHTPGTLYALVSLAELPWIRAQCEISVGRYFRWRNSSLVLWVVKTALQRYLTRKVQPRTMYVSKFSLKLTKILRSIFYSHEDGWESQSGASMKSRKDEPLHNRTIPNLHHLHTMNNKHQKSVNFLKENA